MSSTNDTLNDGCTNLVRNRFLFLIGSCDEELVLNVDKMFAVLDNLDISIGNGMLP